MIEIVLLQFTVGEATVKKTKKNNSLNIYVL